MLVFAELSWRRRLYVERRREVESENKGKDRDFDAGGNAAREGGRDACGGHGAHFWVVRH